MNVIAFMALIGLGLVALSIVFFIHQTNSGSGGEQDALLPFAEESPRLVPEPRTPHSNLPALGISPESGGSTLSDTSPV